MDAAVDWIRKLLRAFRCVLLRLYMTRLSSTPAQGLIASLKRLRLSWSVRMWTRPPRMMHGYKWQTYGTNFSSSRALRSRQVCVQAPAGFAKSHVLERQVLGHVIKRDYGQLTEKEWFQRHTFCPSCMAHENTPCARDYMLFNEYREYRIATSLGKHAPAVAWESGDDIESMVEHRLGASLSCPR